MEDHLNGFQFTVPMKAIAKPRMTRSDVWKDPPRPAVAKYREFVDAVRAAIIDAKRDAEHDVPDDWTLKGNVSVTISFMPDATFVKVEEIAGKQRGKRAGDIDNFSKSVLEALQEFQEVPILIDDDSQVTILFAEITDQMG